MSDQLLQANQVQNWLAKSNMPDLLLSLGEDLTREGLQDTPRRIDKAWREMLSGYTMDADKILGTTFEAEEARSMQVCKYIHFVSVCEHHLLPFSGYAHIAYIPNKRVVGLSKLPRLVDCFARRLQIQERLVQLVANEIVKAIDPIGVYVMAEAKHYCCHGRGVKLDRMSFTTTAKRGEIDMTEFQTLIGNNAIDSD